MDPPPPIKSSPPINPPSFPGTEVIRLLTSILDQLLSSSYHYQLHAIYLEPPPPSQQFLFWWILSTKKRGNDLKIFKLSVGLILKSKNLKLSVCLLYKSKNTWLVELPAWYPLCPVWIEINGFSRFWSSDIGSHINIQFKHFFLISGQLT